MDLALGGKKIECTNCGYSGKGQMKSGDLGMWLFWLLTVLVGFFFIPVFILTGMMLFWLVYKPQEQICPKCKSINPVG